MCLRLDALIIRQLMPIKVNASFVKKLRIGILSKPKSSLQFSMVGNNSKKLAKYTAVK